MPIDANVKNKERERLERYQMLSDDIQRLWKIREVEIVPILIKALGSAPFKLKRKYEENRPGE